MNPGPGRDHKKGLKSEKHAEIFYLNVFRKIQKYSMSNMQVSSCSVDSDLSTYNPRDQGETALEYVGKLLDKIPTNSQGYNLSNQNV